MRKILLLIGIMILGLEASAFAAALDAPHNQTNAFACADCHAASQYPVDDVCLACHINDTGAGFSRLNAPKVLTHSSENTSTKYGTWTQLCKDCHQPHTQNQRELNGSATYLVTGTITKATRNVALNQVTYDYNNMTALKAEWADFTKWGHKSSNQAGGNGRGLILFPNVANFGLSAEIISATATQITVQGYPGTVAVGSSFAIVYGQHMSGTSGGRAVRFYNNSGANSFAYDESATGTDSTPDGICQVCHTQTGHWRTDGTLAGIGVHSGQNGANCVTCHPHEQGFKAAGCNTCHGYPPTSDVASGGPNGLVNNPAPTGSVYAGKHSTHVTGLGIDCSVCHYNSKGAGATHNDGTVQAITMGFYVSSAVQGGSYDGQSTADYNVTATTPSTSVTNSGTLQCSNLYCHSTGQGANGGALAGGDYKTPAWNGTVVCGDCHKAVMDSGSHTAHISAPLSKTCSECHKNAGEGTASHANADIEVAFNVDPFSNTASYSQMPNTPGNGYGTCATVYCHSIGQRNGGSALVSGTADYKSPAWGGTAACGSCHDAVMASGSHTSHLNVAGYDCATCHTNAGSATAKHADGNIDTEFNAAQAGGSGSYSQTGTPGNGYGTCSTVFCHGTTSPQWGADFTGVATCEKCHGSAATAAIGNFKDTAGNTSGARVGAHVAHLASTHNYTNDIVCSDCHGVPAGVTTAGHIDTALPAEVNVARGYAAGTCSTTYCHGIGIKNNWPGANNRTPSWGDTTYLTGVAANDCAQCHGYPPGGGHPGATPSTCKDCHPGVNDTGTGFTDPSTHVDGTVQATGGDDCNSCHTNANLSARHTVHTNPDTILTGKKLSTLDYGNLAWWYSYSNVGGVPTMGCGYCHPQDSATHRNGTRNLNFAPNDAGAAGTLKAKNGIAVNYSQNAGTSVICSSVYCHSNGYDDGTGYVYQTSPDWYGGNFSGDKCANCHGNSPNSGGKPGSLSHYNPNAMGMGVVGGHFVGIHYKNVFTGTTGVTKDASLRQNAHGTAATSTTINCQTCHNSTVSMAGNDLNTVCASCHTAPSKGTMSIDALATTHINGTPDVAFEPLVVKSKAQVRDDISGVAELSSNWTRTTYKLAGSADTAVSALNTGLDYAAGTKTCTVACHNGNSVTWSAVNITCNSCHTSLP